MSDQAIVVSNSYFFEQFQELLAHLKKGFDITTFTVQPNHSFIEKEQIYKQE